MYRNNKEIILNLNPFLHNVLFSLQKVLENLWFPRGFSRGIKRETGKEMG